MGIHLGDITSDVGSKAPLLQQLTFKDLHEYLRKLGRPLAIAIDGNMMLNTRIRVDTSLSRMWLQNLLRQYKEMLDAGLSVLYVFDGKPLDAKLKTLDDRQKKRDAHAQKAESADANEDEKASARAQALVVHNELAIFKCALRALGCNVIQCVQNCDAEKVIAQLQIDGVVGAVMTNDYDVFAYGATLVVGVTGKSRKYPVTHIKNDKFKLYPLTIADKHLRTFGVQQYILDQTADTLDVDVIRKELAKKSIAELDALGAKYLASQKLKIGSQVTLCVTRDELVRLVLVALKTDFSVNTYKVGPKTVMTSFFDIIYGLYSFSEDQAAAYKIFTDDIDWKECAEYVVGVYDEKEYNRVLKTAMKHKFIGDTADAQIQADLKYFAAAKQKNVGTTSVYAKNKMLIFAKTGSYEEVSKTFLSSALDAKLTRDLFATTTINVSQTNCSKS
jgi:hypothetical protein